MMARTMVYLDPQQLKALKARARAEGVSLAELMRRLVTQHLEQRQPLPPVPPAAYARLVALGSSGRSDISERHDAYLAQALQREHAR
jgi:hypothetical protein